MLDATLCPLRFGPQPHATPRTTHLGRKYPIDLDLGCYIILPRQQVATVAVHYLPEQSDFSQQEIVTDQVGHLAFQLKKPYRIC